LYLDKGSELIPLNIHFLIFFGDLDKSFSLGNAHASMALASLNHDFIVNEAMALVTTAFVSEAALDYQTHIKKKIENGK